MKNLKRIVSALLIFAIVFVYIPTKTAAQDNYEGYYNEYASFFSKDLFRQIFDIYAEQHLYEFTKEELMYAFVENLIKQNPYMFESLADALLSTMDPYSAYYSYESNFLSGKSSGLGVVLGFYTDEQKQNGQGTYIDEVIPGSSAEEAGLLAGDKLICANGILLSGMDFSGVSSVISAFPKENENGSLAPIILEAQRGDEILKFNIVKAPFSSKEVFLTFNEEEKIAQISVNGFVSNTVVADFKNALKKIKDAGYEKLILDLRNNGGGLFDYAIEMADFFIRQGGVTLCKQADRNGTITEFTSKADDDFFSFEKVAILADDTTVSAAELFTMILQYHNIATVIGDHTYGKSVGQMVYTVSNGDYFTVTTFEVVRPNETSYYEEGLTPDIYAPMTEVKYELPPLPYFNHTNYLEIGKSKENEPTLAFEKRMAILGLLSERYADGIYDEYTEAAIRALQLCSGAIAVTGSLTDADVTYITSVINSYKNRYYYADSTYDVAVMFFKSFDRARRLAKEWIREGEKTQKQKAEYEEAMKKEIEELLEKEKQEQESAKVEKEEEEITYIYRFYKEA